MCGATGALHITGHELADHSDPSRITIALERPDGATSATPAAAATHAAAASAAAAATTAGAHALGRGGAAELSEMEEGSASPLLGRPAEAALGGASSRPLPALRVLDRVPAARAPSEVLVYVPGFNASVEDDIMSLGQLLCLGDFPPHVKGILFAWPGGRELTYFSAINYAKHPRCQVGRRAARACSCACAHAHAHVTRPVSCRRPPPRRPPRRPTLPPSSRPSSTRARASST